MVMPEIYVPIFTFVLICVNAHFIVVKVMKLIGWIFCRLGQCCDKLSVWGKQGSLRLVLVWWSITIMVGQNWWVRRIWPGLCSRRQRQGEKWKRSFPSGRRKPEGAAGETTSPPTTGQGGTHQECLSRKKSIITRDIWKFKIQTQFKRLK